MTTATSIADSGGSGGLLGPALRLAQRGQEFLDHTVLHKRAEPGWTTDNRVVLERAAHLLRLFTGDKQTSQGAPVLVVPPEVNQSTIVDFAPGQSLVRAFVEAGFDRVAAIEWRSDATTRRRDIDDSLLSILDCIDALGGRVHLVGVCQGGWESAIVAALRPDAVATLTLVAAPIDCHAGHGIIKRLARSLPMTAYRALVGLGGGEMKNEIISLGFDSLLPFERFALKYLSLYNRLDNQAWLARYHRIDDWYRTPKNLPGPLYLRAVRELFKENRLFEGRFIALGSRVDLSRITCPLALVAGRRDHITPPEQVWAARAVTGSSDVLEVETSGGHVGTFMGRRELSERWPVILRWLRDRDAA